MNVLKIVKLISKVDLRDEVVDDAAKEEKAGEQGKGAASASTPRRPAPRGPTIQKQRGGVK